MSRLVRLALVAAAMTVFLTGMLGWHLYKRATGTEIVLAVEGYDPRDVFLGHYSQIRTPLHRLDASRLAGRDDFERGDAIYVVLDRRHDGTVRPSALRAERPEDGLYALGRVETVHAAAPEPVQLAPADADATPAANREAARTWIGVTYNIERYYASERVALALERRLRARPAGPETNGPETNRVRLIVSVPADGHLLIRGLELDGERWIDTIWGSGTPLGEDGEEDRRQ